MTSVCVELKVCNDNSFACETFVQELVLLCLQKFLHVVLTFKLPAISLLREILYHKDYNLCYCYMLKILAL